MFPVGAKSLVNQRSEPTVWKSSFWPSTFVVTVLDRSKKSMSKPVTIATIMNLSICEFLLQSASIMSASQQAAQKVSVTHVTGCRFWQGQVGGEHEPRAFASHNRAEARSKYQPAGREQVEASKGLRGKSLPRTSAGTSSIGKAAAITAARVPPESRCSNIARCYHNENEP
jgi:hypothetical protein